MTMIPQRTPLAEVMSASYGDPRPCDSLEGFKRWNHADIAEMTDDELDSERVLCRLRYAATPPALRSAWLLERLPLLEAEAARRQQQRRAAGRW